MRAYFRGPYSVVALVLALLATQLVAAEFEEHRHNGGEQLRSRAESAARADSGEEVHHGESPGHHSPRLEGELGRPRAYEGNKLGNLLDELKHKWLGKGAPLSLEGSKESHSPSHEEKKHGEYKHKEVEEQKENSVFDSGLKTITHWAKLIFQPLELIKAIGAFFKIPVDGLVEKVGKGLIVGVEALFQPVIVSIKIFERIFHADPCRMRLICKIGSRLTLFKAGALKLDGQMFEGSYVVKAFTDGIIGRDCETLHAKCEPKLQPDIKALGRGRKD